jgi:hypothetical protein
MADESHTKQGQIERAQRLRKIIEDMKRGKPAAKGGSLKEQVEEKAEQVKKNEDETCQS